MAYSLDPKRFVQHVGSWLDGGGPESDVVVSCRVRLARNVDGYPFVLRLDDARARELGGRVRDILLEQRIDGETIWVGMEEAPAIVKLLLRERYLVSRDLAPNDPRLAARPGRGVAFGENEQLAVMVNEEDHLRLQSLSPGYALRDAFERVRALDQALERELAYAVDPQFGYLTGCPTNVGTGLRASVMLHLPALGMVRSELEKVMVASQRTGLAVRGMYGEGSGAAGDFYQVSNQVTLGSSEEELIAELEELVPCIVAFERRVREALFQDQRAALEDRVQRSYGMLRTARSIATEVALMHLSNVRLGVLLGLVVGVELGELARTAVQIQKGHVHLLVGDGSGKLAEATERDKQRAAFLRKKFAAG
ncbi:MAG TPA: ATP--guanido phosphotransferase [Planctomycetota bacterium]